MQPLGIFMNNFKNVTEMEVVMRFGMVVACAVKDLDIWVHLKVRRGSKRFE